MSKTTESPLEIYLPYLYVLWHFTRKKEKYFSFFPSEKDIPFIMMLQRKNHFSMFTYSSSSNLGHKIALRNYFPLMLFEGFFFVMQKSLSCWISSSQLELQQNDEYVVRDARIQIPKLSCAILRIIPVTIPDISPVLSRKFGSICVYLSIHLFLAVTLNFIMNFDHISQGMQSLLKFCENTVQ